MKLLAMTEDERAFKTEQRDLALDANGDEILIGLTREESEWYIIDQRTWFEQRHSGTRSPKDKERFISLSDKHNLARLRAIGLMHLPVSGTA